jgi:hypothetical protein
MRNLRVVAALCVLAGCASVSVDYRPPSITPRPNQTKDVSRPKDQVWNDTVAALGQRFFVINNLDKSSGLINISYSGDPLRYVDCGSGSVNISGPGAKTQMYDGAAADVQYQTVVPMPPYGVPTPVPVRRQMSLEGRVNVIFEALAPGSTRVTTATRYVLTRRLSAPNTIPHTDTIAFNANEKGYFPRLGTSPPLECVSTGELEKSILSEVK